MTTMSGKAVNAVWLALLGATLASYWYSRHVPLQFAILAIMVFAGAKIGLVLMHFMELGHAPPAVRIFFVAWILACAGLVATLHEVAGS